MPRYALKLEYDGTPFVGWQRQPEGLLSIQQVVEEAAAPLNGGEVPLVTAAGRTDAGVHAEGQVVDLLLAADLPPERVREAINARTAPHPVVAVACARVADDWSARFTCIGRGYLYRIANRPARPAIEAGRLVTAAVISGNRNLWRSTPPLACGLEPMRLVPVGARAFKSARKAPCSSNSSWGL